MVEILNKVSGAQGKEEEKFSVAKVIISTSRCYSFEFFYTLEGWSPFRHAFEGSQYGMFYSTFPLILRHHLMTEQVEETLCFTYMTISPGGLQVIQAADDVIGLVDKDALARHFAMKSEAEDQDAAVILPGLYFISSLTSCS